MKIMRAEHPRPDLFREDWLSLNGEWEFEFDDELVGEKSHFWARDSFGLKINVPFSPESVLSGIGDTDFHRAVWYKRSFAVPCEWSEKRVILHIGACDFATRVYINGKIAGEHRGGYTPIRLDITDLLSAEENSIAVYAIDDTTSDKQQSGKQSCRRESYGCFYTRTTGIWQSVWLEAVGAAHVLRYNAIPSLADKSAKIVLSVSKAAVGANAVVTAYYEGREVGAASAEIVAKEQSIALPLSELHLWELGEGRLYDLKIELVRGGVSEDRLSGYFGMREIKLEGGALRLNGKEIFGRFVLDQGFYPDGIYTAPTDEALVGDIKSAMALGFNGARMHQKVFEPRYLYHADRLGYMLFDEGPNWGLDWTTAACAEQVYAEWREVILRDIAHPSVIGWCPFNETWDKDGKPQCDELIDGAYYLTKTLDQTRIVVTNSGSYPSLRDRDATDVHDIHDYEQNPAEFRKYYELTSRGTVKCQLWREDSERQKYNGKPIFMSEYGGIKLAAEDNADNDRLKSWGYGDAARSEAKFLTRLEGLTDVILENGDFFAFCYTQLYDVEQEENGLMTYDRKFKINPADIARIIAKPRKK